MPLLVVGIGLKLGVLWAGGSLSQDQIKTFLDVIERYQWWIVIGLFAITFVQSANLVRRSVPEVIEEYRAPSRTSGTRRRATVQGWTGAPTPSEPVAVVTGEASSGIGAATARRLVKEGFQVVLGACRLDRLHEVADETGGRALELDVTDAGSVERFARPGARVRRAGEQRRRRHRARSHRVVVRCRLGVDVRDQRPRHRAAPPAPCCRCWRRAVTGTIVTMGSVAGIEPYPGGAGYNAAKFSVRAFTQVLRLELLGRPIRITEVDPGMVETEFSVVRFRGDAERAAKVYEGVDALSADDVADCVAFAVTRPSHVNLDQIVVTTRTRPWPAPSTADLQEVLHERSRFAARLHRRGRGPRHLLRRPRSRRSGGHRPPRRAPRRPGHAGPHRGRHHGRGVASVDEGAAAAPRCGARRRRRRRARHPRHGQPEPRA